MDFITDTQLTYKTENVRRLWP